MFENLLLIFSVGIFAVFGAVMFFLFVILYWVKT
jgi:hypothetical protein